MQDIRKTDENQIDEEAIARSQAEALQAQISDRLDQLSLNGLQTVLDFAAFLLDKESEEATQELLEIPGFAERFAQAQEEIAKGQTKTLNQLKRKIA
ncbi:hypothetical protein LEP3755_52940 [Leptolyngbya sp. NIES-3755]|nr:hypothetical protein LEP3755_52940 [Leptolyngbya sp. NIES-3755]